MGYLIIIFYIYLYALKNLHEFYLVNTNFITLQVPIRDIFNPAGLEFNFDFLFGQIETFTAQKQLSTSLISGCKEIMQVRNTIRRLMVRCESISQQMGLVVSRLTGGGRGGDGELHITKQPEVLNNE